MKKQSELEKAKKSARLGVLNVSRMGQRKLRGDLTKHFIRVYHWEKRIRNLMHARTISCVRYLSLCGEDAFDVRLFRKKRLVGSPAGKGAIQPSFVYCEKEDNKFEILNKTFQDDDGFKGEIERISTDSANNDFGKFWGRFPFDVINLDFWGDIHKMSQSSQDVFYAIRSIIFQQALLKEQYELWITERAKHDRTHSVIIQEYRELIRYNYQNVPNFKKAFDKNKLNINKLNNLPFDDVVRIAFLKWLMYQVKCAFSFVEDLEILVYQRKDKGGETYNIYNFLLRIKPYELVPLPSPASQAARSCEDEYKDKINLCFKEPINIDQELRKLGAVKRRKLAQELKELQEEFQKERAKKMA